MLIVLSGIFQQGHISKRDIRDNPFSVFRAARIWTIPLFQNTAPAVDVRIVVEERSFYIKTNKQKKNPQPLTPLQLEQQSIKYCSLKFKL